MKKIISFLLSIFLLFSHSFPAIERFKTERKSYEKKAEEKLAELTIEEKIGQMILPAFTTGGASVSTADVTRAMGDNLFGGVILFSETTKHTADTTALICDIQSTAEIPMFIAVDQEGGYVTRLGEGTMTAGNMALGAAGDEALAEKAGALIGRELSAIGFNLDFAPDMDVNNNPNNPIIGIRSFSDDPALVSSLGAAMIDGLHSENVMTSLKHFPGHGDTGTDSHTGLPSINKTLEELEKCELIPFRAGIEAGTDMIMTAHISFPKIEKSAYASKKDGKKVTLPATLSKTIITDILRGELGYDGVVCTDAMNMGAITEHFGSLDAARLAINAGADILLMPVTIRTDSDNSACEEYLDAIVGMVKDGQISEETVNAAVKRILTLKYKRGLMDQSPVDKDTAIANALSIVGSEANHAEEFEIALRGVTLVKNDGILPINVADGGKVALFCSYENEVNAMEYALRLLRENGMLPKSADCKVFCYNGQSSLTDNQRAFVNSADAVITSFEAYGSSDLAGGWQAAFVDSLIAYTHSLGKKISFISIQLPYDVARFDKADAVLAAYGSMGMSVIPGTQTGALPKYGPNISAAVYTVLGGNEPSGTLPVSIPKLDSGNNYTSEILYPTGYGKKGY